MKPELGLSLGDPAGIGPEVTLRAAANARVRRACRLVVYGDEQVLELTRRRLGISRTAATAITRIEAVRSLRARAALPKPGRACGAAAFAFLDAAAHAVAAGEHDALVTAPINKLWMQRAGHDYDGHTGYLSELAGTEATMMLAGRTLRVVLATTHIALKDVAGHLGTDAIVRAARATIEHLRVFHAVAKPRLAVAALNPHAGEEGLFGDEESRIIEPAVRALRRSRQAVEGPFPADTLFATARTGHYDAVVCMYHDQALIPLKLLEFGRSVNVSMGLPFIRTSPDHGTAYDVAGTGQAKPDSMIEAILVAAQMVRSASGASIQRRRKR
jgi:4-hydroxythreonine-4-phosphate dehydrogenase